MATRQIPNSRYFSGQGRVLMGDRDPVTGVGKNFLEVGNVPDLSIDTANTKFTHKESMSGGRNQDIINFKDKTTTAKFTFESLSRENLAMGLYGPSALIGGVGGSTLAIVAEPHVYDRVGAIIPLRRPNVDVSTVVVKQGSTTIPNTNYTVDATFGTIRFNNATVSGLTAGQAITVDYSVLTTGVSVEHIDALAATGLIEKYFRFEGLNTLNGDAVLVQIPRFALDPAASLALINDELGSLPMTGNVLLDPFITGSSQFYTVDYIPGA